jgi:hypothetical protein
LLRLEQICSKSSWSQPRRISSSDPHAGGDGGGEGSDSCWSGVVGRVGGVAGGVAGDGAGVRVGRRVCVSVRVDLCVCKFESGFVCVVVLCVCVVVVLRQGGLPDEVLWRGSFDCIGVFLFS